MCLCVCLSVCLSAGSVVATWKALKPGLKNFSDKAIKYASKDGALIGTSNFH